MTIPAPVCTVSPTSVNRTYADLAPTVQLGDSSSPSPAASGRVWEADTVAVKSTTGASGAGISSAVPYPVNLAAGTRQLRVKTTNADGTGTSSDVAVTVTDAVASSMPAKLTDPNLLQVRTNPISLPNEYKDPTKCTPGDVTATGCYNARTGLA
jgi:hypothetical protein